jgi:hypothetical protein
MTGQRGADGEREYFGAAAVYAAGAVAFYVARESLELDFLASPLFYGVMLLIASYFRRRLLASALILICWGVAVLLDGRGPIEPGAPHRSMSSASGWGRSSVYCSVAGSRSVWHWRAWRSS